MNALGHWLEVEGIATTGISLIRKHSEWMRPPRLLWVPFPLGRPLGRPGDAAFQQRVIEAALALLDAPAGPVLADFAEEAGADEPHVAWSCPVSLPPPEAEAGSATRLRNEMTALAPWYDRNRERRGRTTVGASALSIGDVVTLLLDFADGADEPAELPQQMRLKHACEDLKAWYLEATAGQPGARNPAAASAWLWSETEAGRLLHRVADRAAASTHPVLRMLGKRALVPREVQRGGS